MSTSPSQTPPTTHLPMIRRTLHAPVNYDTHPILSPYTFQPLPLHKPSYILNKHTFTSA